MILIVLLVLNNFNNVVVRFFIVEFGVFWIIILFVFVCLNVWIISFIVFFKFIKNFVILGFVIVKGFLVLIFLINKGIIDFFEVIILLYFVL